MNDNFYLSEDHKIPVDVASKNDYRMFVPVSKLKLFVGRFDKTTDRELVKSLDGKFREELVATGNLDFENIECRYCGRHFTNIEFSRHFQCYELLLADIVELLPTAEQEDNLRELIKFDSNEYFLQQKKKLNIVEL